MQIYFILPSSDLTGPIRGAFAIANMLVRFHSVTIIFLKGNHFLENHLDTKIKIISLNENKFFISKIINARRIIKSGSRNQIRLLSMCLSADFLSIFLHDKAITISSIRGNLYKNYSCTYSLLGYFLAFFHISIQRFFDKTIVMNMHMYRQIKPFIKKNPLIIKNFIDEKYISKYFTKSINKNKPFSFVFVGSLINRKAPMALLNAIKQLDFNYEVNLHFIGDGPLKSKINSYIQRNNLERVVKVHGFLSNPYEIVSCSDVFVLPSYSEGTPRAALEALFLGVPCILRNVEGNKELKDDKTSNVVLFEKDIYLSKLMIETAHYSRDRICRSNLLPDVYRSDNILFDYMNILK